MSAAKESPEASLVEIGKLILILHEEFLKNVVGPADVLIALCMLVDDFDLSGLCSMLDIEVIRRKLMKTETQMDFEVFFNFLKLFADCIFSSTIGNNNLSFLSLFSEYIVPYCQRGGQLSANSKGCTYSDVDFHAIKLLTSQSIDSFVHYRQFLMHFYIRTHSAEYRHTNLSLSWRNLYASNNEIALEDLLSHFKLIDLCPSVVTEQTATNCIRDSMTKDFEGLPMSTISFPLFLYFLEQLSLSIPVTVPADASDEDVITIKLENMMALLVNKSFNYMLQNFVMYDQSQLVAPISDVDKSSLSLSSILWLLRQTSLIQSEDLNLSELFHFIRIELNLVGIDINQSGIINSSSSSSASHSSSGSSKSRSTAATLVPAVALLPLLNQLVYKILQIPNVDTIRRKNSQLQDRGSLFLASNLPSAIFAAPKRIPSALYLLYCIDNLSALGGAEAVVNSLVFTFSTKKKASSSSDNPPASLSRLWSMNSFLDICRKKNVIPDVIYENLILKSSEYVFGKIIFEQDSNDIIRSFIDIFEILFVLSQFVNTLDNTSGASPARENVTPELALKNFNSLLRVLCQYLGVSESDIQSTSSATVSISSARIKSYAEKSSNQLDQQTSLIANAVSKAKRDEDVINEPTGNSLRDVTVLLIHFPLNSYKMNPWEVVQMFLSMSKYNEVNFEADPRISLSHVFKKFCRQYNIRPEDLARFFAFRYEKIQLPSAEKGKSQKMVMKANCRAALSDPLLDFILADRTLRLLYANSDLMKWEYSKAFASYREGDPFFESNISPVLCSMSMDHYGDRAMLSPLSAVAWACRSFNLTKEQVETCFTTTSVLGVMSSSYHMPFSSFIIFSIRCFWCKTCNKFDISLENFVDLIRGMLQVFSDSLTRVQQSVRLCILVPLMGSDKGIMPFLSVNERITVAKMAGSYFESKLSSSSYFNSNSTIKFLNPRLPLKLPESRSFLCDAPRFVEFTKILGLHQFSDTILCSWFCFGTFIRSLNPPGLDSWPDSVVPPLPINLDYLAILNLINSLVHIYGDDEYFVKESDGSMRGLHLIISKYILPLLCSAHAMKTDPILREKPPVVDSTLGTFEDVLRYGGDQTINALDTFRSWIEECYNNLSYSSYGRAPSGGTGSSQTNLEPPVNIVCTYLSLHGLLKIGTIAMLVKRSLNPRVRPTSINNSFTNNSPFVFEVATVSLSEFEEIIMRTAFYAWDVSGAGLSKPHATNFQNQESPKGSSANSNNSFNSPVGPNLTFDLSEVADRYCRESLVTISTKSANSRLTWGINFLKPFIVTAQEFGYFPKIAPSTIASRSGDSSSSKSSISSGSGSDYKVDKKILSGRDEYGSVSSAISTDFSNSSGSTSTSGESILKTHLQLRKNDLMSIAQNHSTNSNGSGSNINLGSKQIVTVPSMQASRMPNDGNEGVSQQNSSATRNDESTSTFLKDMYQQRLNHSFKDPVLRGSAGLDDDDTATSHSSSSRISDSSKSFGSYRRGLREGREEETDATFESINFAFDEDAAKYFPPLNILKKTITLNASENSSKGGADDYEDDTEFSIVSKDKPSSPKMPLSQAIENVLNETKEQLWPVFATYCSCGDSMEPGKLSGPNLFTLLSKLGVLSDLTVLSDVGILLHQISAHTPAHSPLAIATMTSEELCETPSLTFEEFLIFLCAFSQLRFEGQIVAPLKDDSLGKSKKRIGKEEQEKWFEKWQAYMCKSRSFRRLLEECVLPVLIKHPVIASPEHARHRDRYSTIFSLDVLTAIEGSERPLQNCFRRERELALAAIKRPPNAGLSIEQVSSIILNALQRINLGNALQRIKLDHILETSHIIQLVADVMPALLTSGANQSSTLSPKGSVGSKYTSEMCFPQWEWILSVVAYEAVDIAVRESTIPTPPDQVPSLMADLITSIAGAMKASF